MYIFATFLVSSPPPPPHRVPTGLQRDEVDYCENARFKHETKSMKPQFFFHFSHFSPAVFLSPSYSVTKRLCVALGHVSNKKREEKNRSAFLIVPCWRPLKVAKVTTGLVKERGLNAKRNQSSRVFPIFFFLRIFYIVCWLQGCSVTTGLCGNVFRNGEILNANDTKSAEGSSMGAFGGGSETGKGENSSLRDVHHESSVEGFSSEGSPAQFLLTG